jgi:hypothetical protein
MLMQNVSLLAIIAGILLVAPVVVTARTPSIIFPQQAPIEIASVPPQSIFGELIGFPQEFRVMVAEPHSLFVQILSPPVDGATIDFAVAVTHTTGDTAVPLVALTATSAPWSAWKDPWGGDVYRVGPSAEVPLAAGVYSLTVSSPDNSGKFVLYIGAQDRPSVVGLATMIAKLPIVKAYLGVAPRDAFNNRLGAIAAGSVIAVLIVLFWIIRKIRRGRTHKLPRIVA